MIDRDAYRQFLSTRQLNQAQIEQHFELAEGFEEFIGAMGLPPDRSKTNAGRAFIAALAGEGGDSYDNILALARYGRFTGDNDVYLAALELLDGGEVMNNLYERLAQAVGEVLRDQVFEGLPLPTWGMPTTARPRLMQAVLERMQRLVDPLVIDALLSACLRDLPDEAYQADRQLYAETGDFDRFLEIKRRQFIAQLERLRETGGLFFNQEITQAVIDFVRSSPEISVGVRQGNILYVTKIPYLAAEYLAESDLLKKRYYACHCPWARESILRSDSVIPARFCLCSAGFHKKGWEVIFEQPLQVEVLESAIQGDLRCRFAIHLPEGVPGG